MAAGHAALAICESLLLALTEQNVISDRDVRGVLEDAAAVHRGAVDGTPDAAMHREAASLIDRILADRSSLS